MSTVREQQEKTIKKQLTLAVRDLIKSMNSESTLDIAIVEEKTNDTSFEFSLEYPPYEDSRQKFHRRVSNIEAEEFICNVLANIEELLGYKYMRGSGFISISVPPNEKFKRGISVKLFSDSNGKLRFFKILHVRITFVEDKGR